MGRYSNCTSVCSSSMALPGLLLIVARQDDGGNSGRLRASCRAVALPMPAEAPRDQRRLQSLRARRRGTQEPPKSAAAQRRTHGRRARRRARRRAQGRDGHGLKATQLLMQKSAGRTPEPEQSLLMPQASTYRLRMNRHEARASQSTTTSASTFLLRHLAPLRWLRELRNQGASCSPQGVSTHCAHWPLVHPSKRGSSW